MIPLLQVLFIAFKLAGIIEWSWWAVMSPLMVHVAIFTLDEITKRR
jgi:hypothetical protein